MGISDVPEEGLPALRIPLHRRQGCLGDRIPVDEVVASVDQSVIEHLFKHRPHGAVFRPRPW